MGWGRMADCSELVVRCRLSAFRLMLYIWHRPHWQLTPDNSHLIIMKFTRILLLAFVIVTSNLNAQTKLATVASPDKKIEVTVWLGTEGKPLYSVTYAGEPVLKPSKLGLICDDGDFSASLQLVSVSAVKKVTDNYRMINAKRERCVY